MPVNFSVNFFQYLLKQILLLKFFVLYGLKKIFIHILLLYRPQTVLPNQVNIFYLEIASSHQKIFNANFVLLFSQNAYHYNSQK